MKLREVPLYMLFLIVGLGIIVYYSGRYSHFLSNKRYIYHRPGRPNAGRFACGTIGEDPAGKPKQMSIMVRMTSTKEMLRRYFCQFLRTLLVFWPPKLGSVVLVFDAESKADHSFWQTHRKQIHDLSLEQAFTSTFESKPKNDGILNFTGMIKPLGYNRQLWSTFWADLHTTSEIIVYMDTDVQFVLPVTDNLLFKDGKPRVFGSDDFQLHWWIHDWDKTTRLALGLPLVANFMVTFPQTIYRDTYTACRNYILTYLKETDFEVAFSKFYRSGDNLSPINIILSYAWYFERERYSWHIKTNNLEKLNEHLPNSMHIGKEHTTATVFPALHAKGKVSEPDFILYGYCFFRNVTENLTIKACSRIDTSKGSMCDFHEAHFRGPGFNTNDCEKAVESYRLSLKISLKNGDHPRNWNHINHVDKMISSHGIDRCEPFEIG